MPKPFTKPINVDTKENGIIKQEEEKEMKNEITMPITLGEYEMIMKKREEETKEKLDSEFSKRREEFNKKQEKKVVLNKVTSDDKRGIKELLIDIEKLLKEINKSLDK